MKVENLKAARESAGYSQKSFAEKIGVSQQRYNNYEDGKREPSHGVLITIADELGVSADYLLGRDETVKKKGEATALNAFDRAEFGGLTQEEVDMLAMIADGLKTVRGRGV